MRRRRRARRGGGGRGGAAAVGGGADDGGAVRAAVAPADAAQIIECVPEYEAAAQLASATTTTRSGTSTFSPTSRASGATRRTTATHASSPQPHGRPDPRWDQNGTCACHHCSPPTTARSRPSGDNCVGEGLLQRMLSDAARAELRVRLYLCDVVHALDNLPEAHRPRAARARADPRRRPRARATWRTCWATPRTGR